MKVHCVRELVTLLSEVYTLSWTKQKPWWEERHKRRWANAHDLRDPVLWRLGFFSFQEEPRLQVFITISLDWISYIILFSKKYLRKALWTCILSVQWVLYEYMHTCSWHFVKYSSASLTMISPYFYSTVLLPTLIVKL